MLLESWQKGNSRPLGLFKQQFIFYNKQLLMLLQMYCVKHISLGCFLRIQKTQPVRKFSILLSFTQRIMQVWTSLYPASVPLRDSNSQTWPKMLSLKQFVSNLVLTSLYSLLQDINCRHLFIKRWPIMFLLDRGTLQMGSLARCLRDFGSR